jgi:hypothetical protein
MDTAIRSHRMVTVQKCTEFPTTITVPIWWLWFAYGNRLLTTCNSINASGQLKAYLHSLPPDQAWYTHAVTVKNTLTIC